MFFRRIVILVNHDSKNSRDAELRRLLAQRIVILDGAMGTTIREYGLGEVEIRGERFKDATKDGAEKTDQA